MRFQNGSNKVVIELRVVQFWSEILLRARSILKSRLWFQTKLHSTQFSYHFIKSILTSQNFMALFFRFWCNAPSRAGLLEIGEPVMLWHLIKYAKRCHVTKTHSSITSKRAVLKWERRQSLSCIKVRFSSPESMMEDLPFFCGWGWYVSLSLEKEFEGAAAAILRWISFGLWNSLGCTMGSCGEFSLLNTVQ